MPWNDQQGNTIHDGDPFVAPDGTQYPGNFPKGEIVGLQWVPEPPVPPMTAEQLRQESKLRRSVAVAAIKVTTAAGHSFDGDETSQGRMTRAIVALGTGLAPSTPWVLSDNTVIQATKAELTEALVLAGQAQSALWVLA